MINEDEEEFVYAQKQALPISSESEDPISQYLLAVRKESLAGPPVTFITIVKHHKLHQHPNLHLKIIEIKFQTIGLLN